MLLTNSSSGGTKRLKKSAIKSLCAGVSVSGNFVSQDVMSAPQPNWCGSKYTYFFLFETQTKIEKTKKNHNYKSQTMPQRDTVAGEATSRSSGSKIKFVVSAS